MTVSRCGIRMPIAIPICNLPRGIKRERHLRLHGQSFRVVANAAVSLNTNCSRSGASPRIAELGVEAPALVAIWFCHCKHRYRDCTHWLPGVYGGEREAGSRRRAPVAMQLELVQEATAPNRAFLVVCGHGTVSRLLAIVVASTLLSKCTTLGALELANDSRVSHRLNRGSVSFGKCLWTPPPADRARVVVHVLVRSGDGDRP